MPCACVFPVTSFETIARTKRCTMAARLPFLFYLFFALTSSDSDWDCSIIVRRLCLSVFIVFASFAYCRARSYCTARSHSVSCLICVLYCISVIASLRLLLRLVLSDEEVFTCPWPFTALACRFVKHLLLSPFGYCIHPTAIKQVDFAAAAESGGLAKQTCYKPEECHLQVSSTEHKKWTLRMAIVWSHYTAVLWYIIGRSVTFTPSGKALTRHPRKN